MTDYAYPKHCHDHWTVLIVDDGAIGYDLDDHPKHADVASVNLLPPHVTHDGHPIEQSFRKRVLYLDATWLPDELIGAAVDRSNLDDPQLYRSLGRVHRAIELDDHLAAESGIALATERIRSTLMMTTITPADDPVTAGRLRQYLDAHEFEAVTLADAAAALDRNATHLARSFVNAFAITPHAYLTGRRVDAARRLLLDGMPTADVAVSVGFHDQAHLTRHFRRHTSTTPARYARSGSPLRPSTGTRLRAW